MKQALINVEYQMITFILRLKGEIQCDRQICFPEMMEMFPDILCHVIQTEAATRCRPS